MASFPVLIDCILADQGTVKAQFMSPERDIIFVLEVFI